MIINAPSDMDLMDVLKATLNNNNDQLEIIKRNKK